MNNTDYNYIKQNIFILDIQSLKTICYTLMIDFHIYLENKKTSEILRKEFIIELILYKLKTNKIKKITYSKKIQNYNSTENLNENDYVYYGQYKTTDKNVYKLLSKITNNIFYFGAISQKIVKTNWKNNNLITYKQLAGLWIEEYYNGDIKYKELAYNQFKKNGGSLNEWKQLKQHVINNFKLLKLL